MGTWADQPLDAGCGEVLEKPRDVVVEAVPVESAAVERELRDPGRERGAERESSLGCCNGTTRAEPGREAGVVPSQFARKSGDRSPPL